MGLARLFPIISIFLTTGNRMELSYGRSLERFDTEVTRWETRTMLYKMERKKVILKLDQN